MAASMTAALVLAGCAGQGGDSGGGAQEGTVKIGFIGDITGENNAIVKPPLEGAKLAFEEYNESNPETKIELVEYDSQGKEDQATALARRADTDDKVAGVIGPAFSGESKAAVPTLEKAKIPNVSASATNPALAENGWKYWHRVVANDNDQGPGVVEFLNNAEKPKKAFVVHDDQEYSVGLADSAAKAFKDEGVNVKQQKFEQDEKNYSAVVQSMKSFKPDVIFFGGYYAQGGRLLKQIRDGGLDATFASGDGSYDAEIIKGAGKSAAEGAILTCPCLVDPQGDFATKYKEGTGQEVRIYAAEGYDAATAFVEAVKEGNTDRESINEFLKSVDIEGVAKPIKFEENGNVAAKDIYIYQVVDGALKLLGKSGEAKIEK